MNDIKEKTPPGWRSREHVESDEPEPRRTSKRAWAGMALLALVLIAAGGYGHYILEKYNYQLSELPVLHHSLGAVTDRVGALEGSLRDWTGNWNGLSERMSQLDRRINANLQLARKQAQELMTETGNRIQAQFDERARLLETRVSEVDATNQAQLKRVAELQKDLADARTEMATLREGTGRDLSALQQQMSQSQGTLDSLARQQERQRVDFELSRNRTQELARGISVRVTNINPAYQRFSGWLWFQPDRRTLWIRQQGVQQPVIFYSRQKGERYELVVNSVAQDSVAGYLLLPHAESRSGSSGSSAEEN